MMYTFIGENGSMGLENGKRYNILIDTTEKEKVFAYIQIKINKTIVCPYDSMKSFLNNWKTNNIIHIDLGNTRGIKRTLDNLGRFVIPMEFRKELDFNEDDKLKIFLLNDGLYVTKK